MKKLTLIPIIFFSLTILLTGIISANSLVPPDCYTGYKTRGDSLSRIGNYDQAIAQYQAAKNCSPLSTLQRKTLDDLIADATKRRQQQKLPPRAVIKRY